MSSSASTLSPETALVRLGLLTADAAAHHFRHVERAGTDSLFTHLVDAGVLDKHAANIARRVVIGELNLLEARRRLAARAVDPDSGRAETVVDTRVTHPIDSTIAAFKQVVLDQAAPARPATPSTPVPLPREVSDLAVGQTIGKYLLQSEIGSGAMSRVFLARHRLLDIPVAIKILRVRPGTRESDVRSRFRQEAILMMRIQHPGVVRVYDYDQANGCDFMTMEFVDGPTLQQRLASNTRLEETEALELLVQIVEALKAAFAEGAIHRDLKPSNILLSAGGQAKLTDFGLAGFGSGQLREEDSNVRGGLGTPAYSAPEQIIDCTQADQRSDFYSLGVLLFQLVTGQLPFQAQRLYEIAHMHINTPPPDPRTLNPLLSAETAALVLSLLAKEPGRRPQSHDEFLARLLDCLV
jgi:serine/threonine protein kinase